jgi:DNA polymerase-3 subunit beta
MKFTATKEQLIQRLTHLERVAGRSKELPILSCVYISVSDGEMTLRGTNLEVGVEYTVSVKDAEDGVVAVPAHVFAQTVQTSQPGSSIVCEVKDTTMVVTAGKSVARIATQNSEEFPVIPQVENPKEVSFPAQALISVVKSVVGYTSPSTIKPELASVFVQFDGTEIVSASTDSFRLAEKRASLPKAVESDPFLIPARVVQDLLYLLEDEKGDVLIARNEHQFAIVRSGVYATFRLTTGNFPAYEAVIPKEFDASATLLVADLERVLKKQGIFLDKFYKTTIGTRASDGVCVIDTHNESVGDSHDEIPATIEGEDVAVGFNQKYLIDALGPIPTDSCVLHFAKNKGPLLVVPVGDASFKYIVMPMNR